MIFNINHNQGLIIPFNIGSIYNNNRIQQTPSLPPLDKDDDIDINPKKRKKCYNNNDDDNDELKDDLRQQPSLKKNKKTPYGSHDKVNRKVQGSISKYIHNKYKHDVSISSAILKFLLKGDNYYYWKNLYKVNFKKSMAEERKNIITSRTKMYKKIAEKTNDKLTGSMFEITRITFAYCRQIEIAYPMKIDIHGNVYSVKDKNKNKKDDDKQKNACSLHFIPIDIINVMLNYYNGVQCFAKLKLSKFNIDNKCNKNTNNLKDGLTFKKNKDENIVEATKINKINLGSWSIDDIPHGLFLEFKFQIRNEYFDDNNLFLNKNEKIKFNILNSKTSSSSYNKKYFIIQNKQGKNINNEWIIKSYLSGCKKVVIKPNKNQHCSILIGRGVSNTEDDVNKWKIVFVINKVVIEYNNIKITNTTQFESLYLKLEIEKPNDQRCIVCYRI